jgi:hypothetical protein
MERVFRPNTNTTTYDGRVASSLLYKKEDEDPLWGGDAHKKFYNESTDFFFVPHVKLYLTDAKNQPCSPGDKLSPVKIISDYLQRVHNYCIPKIRKYYDDKKKTEIENESLSVGDTDDIASLKYDFTKDSVRYVFSYPDNEEDGGSKYKEQVTAALIDAGIIRTGDLRENAYESRLSFISDSGATAYYCSTLTSQLKPSLRPYLVCDIGGKNFGISTIIARDLPETGDISSFIDQSGVGCGNLELDRKMGQFLTAKITSTEDADQEVLEKIRDVAFDPVTNKILDQIEKAIKQHEEGVSGIFLSGTIGQDEYLKELVYEKFGSDLKKVMSVQNNEFAVSKGLVQYGIRQRGLMIPYLLQKDVQVIGRLMKLGNEGLDSTTSKTTRNVKKINHKGLDYIIGLGK